MDNRAPLPEGWVARRSKSYPDKVYYFNTNTGESSWEFPDFILSGQVTIKTPTTPQSKSDSLSLTDTSLNNKRKLLTPNSIQSPSDKREDLVPPRNHSLSKPDQPVQKKTRISPIKFPNEKRPENGSVNVSKVMDHGKSKGSVSKNLKLEFSDESRTTGRKHAQLNHNQNAGGKIDSVIDLTCSRKVIDLTSPSKVILSPSSRYKRESSQVHQVKYPPASESCQKKSTKSRETLSAQSLPKSKLVLSSSALDNQKVSQSSKQKESVVQTTIRKSSTSHMDPPPITSQTIVVSSGKSKSIKPQNVMKSKTTVNPPKAVDTKGDNARSSRVTCNSNSKVQADEASDKRNIVKSLQKQNKTTDRTVKAEHGKGLTVNAKTDVEEAPEPLKELTDRPLFRFGDESPDSLVDSDNEGKLKLFIGNKEKLLSIQSWIDNLQQGSDSPRNEFYGLQPTPKESSSFNNESTDSGFLSPGIKTERGWPGVLKSSSVSSRDLVAMEVDTWQLPEIDTRVEESMEVDIDEVILEARELIKSGAVISNGPKENWDPGPSEVPEVVQSVVIVIDTNIFLSNLSQVDLLKDHEIADIGRPTLFIPWVVLQELDVIKESFGGKHKTVQNKARKAIWLLRSFLSKKLPNVRGQTPRQESDASKEFHGTCNDDSILQACLQCQKRFDQCEVILLTNDNNLIVKCMVTGVPAYSSTEIMDALKKLKSKVKHPTDHKGFSVLPSHTTNSSNFHPGSSGIYNNSVRVNVNVFNGPNMTSNCDNIRVTVPVSQTQCPSLSSGTQHPSLEDNRLYQSGDKSDNGVLRNSENEYPHAAQKKCMADSLLQEEQQYTIDTLLEEMYIKLIAVLNEGFGKVLEEEMKLAYDDIWLQIVIKKPPWSFLDILECWKKHWRSVFGMVFRRSLISKVESLLCYFQSNRPRSVKFLFDICSDAMEILRECVRRNRYGDTMFGIKECVLCMYELCEGLMDDTISIQSISSLNDYLKTKLVPDKSSCINSPQQPLHSNYDNHGPSPVYGHNTSPQVSGNIRSPAVSGNIRPPLVSGNIRPPLVEGNIRSPVVPGNIRPPLVSGNLIMPQGIGHNGPSLMPNSNQPTLVPVNNVPFPVTGNHVQPLIPVNHVQSSIPEINRQSIVYGDNRLPLVYANNIPSNVPLPENSRLTWAGPVQTEHTVPFQEQTISNRIYQAPVLEQNNHIYTAPVQEQTNNNRIYTVPHQEQTNNNRIYTVPHQEQTNNNRIFSPLLQEQNNNNQVFLPQVQEQINNNQIFTAPPQEQINNNQIFTAPLQEQANNTQILVNGPNLVNGPIGETSMLTPPVTSHLHPEQQPPGDVVAGELLQHLWQFMFASCNRISLAVSNGSTTDVEKILQQIVPVAKDLRIIYVCLIEVPIPELSMHENDFTQLADVCNSFLIRCGEQMNVKTVTPVQFLMLFSNHIHRETLIRFHAQLDDMLRHLYHCLQVVFPDD